EPGRPILGRALRWVLGACSGASAPCVLPLCPGGLCPLCWGGPRRRAPRVQGGEDRRKPPSSSGLGHRPFKAAARVRIPLGALLAGLAGSTHGPVEQLGGLATLSRWRSRVQ